MKRNIKSLWIAIIILLFFLCLYFISHPTNGQSYQRQIERVCIDQSCKSCKGYIAIADSNLYIRKDTLTNHFLIQKKVEHQGLKSYKLLNQVGRFEICNDVAYLEVFSYGCGWQSEMYYLKE